MASSDTGSRLEAVIFDWGGTLSDHAMVELEDMWLLAARHLAPERGLEVAAQLAAVESAFWERSAMDHRAWTLADLLAEAREAIGADIAEAVFEEAGVHYLDAWTPHIRHASDAGEVLRALRTRGLRVGLLSNTHWPRAFHERFLERDGLARLIDARLYTSEMSYAKPHAEAFGAALAALGVSDPSRAVFVGDRPYDDVYGAQRAGMRGVLRKNPAVPDYDVQPDASIETLSELIDYIDEWL